MTPILVSVTLPSSSVCQTQRCRTIAVLPTTCTVISGNSSDLTVAYRPMTPSMNFALSSSRVGLAVAQLWQSYRLELTPT